MLHKRVTTEKQMEQAKKDERKAMIKQVCELCKEFKIAAGHLKDALAEGRKLKADSAFFTYLNFA